MKRFIFLSLTALFVLTLFGCGDSHPQPQLFSAQIFSDPTIDGDIENTNPPTVRQLPSLVVSLNPLTGVETRAFIHFPLKKVPLNAVINSATLTFFARNIQFNGSATFVPVSIDLVSFPPPLIGPDFYRAFIKTVLITPDLGAGDRGKDVTVDITPLMAEAQRQGLDSLQLRLVAEPPGGLVEIDDTNAAPPQLDVSYF